MFLVHFLRFHFFSSRAWTLYKHQMEISALRFLAHNSLFSSNFQHTMPFPTTLFEEEIKDIRPDIQLELYDHELLITLTCPFKMVMLKNFFTHYSASFPDSCKSRPFLSETLAHKPSRSKTNTPNFRQTYNQTSFDRRNPPRLFLDKT